MASRDGPTCESKLGQPKAEVNGDRPRFTMSPVPKLASECRKTWSVPVFPLIL
jgi:hypothetical protein